MSITPDRSPREQLMDPTAPEAPTMGATDTREQQMPSTDSHRGRNRAYVAGCLVAAAAAAVAGVVLLLNGGDDQPAAAPPTASAPAKSSPTPAPAISTPPTPEDVAVAAAKAKYLEYVRVHDQVAQGGYKNLNLYDAVAISPERTELALEARRTAAVRTTGSSVVATLGVQSVKLTTDPKRSFSEVRLLGCLDVRAVKAFKADGSSAITANRLPRIAFTALVQMVPASSFTEPGRAGRWFVAKVEYPGGGTTC